MKQTRKKNQPARVFWLSGLAIALFVHAIGLLVFKVEEKEAAAPEVDYQFASLPSIPWQEEQGNLLREQAYLQDSAPLFLPTRWNAASSPVVRALEQRPVDLFEPFPARLSYQESDFRLGTFAEVRQESPLESLKVFRNRTHTFFGRGRVPQPELSPRFALIEVRDPGDGRVVLSAPVPGEGAPSLPNRLWRPMEFLLQVEAIGLVGQSVMLEGSGVEEVDQFLRRALRRVVSEQMLDIGYYRVTAGP